MKKKLKVSLVAVAVLLIIALVIWLILLISNAKNAKSAFISNPWNAKTIGSIPAPRGFVRDYVSAGSETAFFRSLPLKPKGSKVKLYTGKNANYQMLSAAVVDIPVLSNSEQCADMTMRLRAEWLFSKGRYSDICFHTVNNKTLRYSGGASRKALNKFLCKAYGICSTYSVYNETTPRKIKDVSPGDVFVYPKRRIEGMGHAIIVVDIARHGNKIALLLAEGNTPARQCHILLNPNLLHNPWFLFDGNETTYQLSVFHFGKNELRHY